MNPPRSDRPTFVVRRSLPSERLGVRNPALTRQIAEMVARQLPDMVAGIQMDAAARKLGHDDAGAGIFRLSVEDIQGGGRGDIDVLAYMSGWVARKQADKRRGG
jgi:hypothetical protein